MLLKNKNENILYFPNQKICFSRKHENMKTIILI